MFFELPDIVALVFFVFLWVGYTVFANWASKSGHDSLSSTLNVYRQDWMSQILSRDMRIPDMHLITIFERNCAFFASSSLLIIAGLLTLLGYSERAAIVVDSLFGNVSKEKMLLVFVVLLIIFVYSFFVFTWSIRQFGFSAIMILSAPLPNTRMYNRKQKTEFAEHTSQVIHLAATNFNYGLRAYYYALAVLFWVIDPFLLILSSIVVTLILYQREFKSATLSALQRAHKDIELPEDNDEQ